MKHNRYYFVFFQAMISIFLTHSSCKAMNHDEENQKKILQEQQSHLLKNESDNSFETINFQAISSNNEQLTTPKTKLQKYGRWLLNNKVAWFTLAVTGTATVIGYKYYSLLDKECHKMENACDGAVDNIDTITQDVDLLKKQLETLYSFIQQCPRARNDFLPEMLTFLKQCCVEQ